MPTKTNLPLPAQVEAGKSYSWCSCGLSQTMPLCDGAHKGASDKKPVSFLAEETKTVYLCACTASQTPPHCDGSHCQID
ncbi:CDGSH iron-sulfur domain-containing protein [Methylobacter luteus]|jgi:CDGSH-type Zn-finger protein|uniref:CDGSH iron-sulfur domain-containing protein n=1 Tax=Methylobacter luteus TaxID=415 RepID=UPI0009DB9603|nr:CDGSH iron-sulfur domain-containing protein [Methylobacter luteus]